MDSPDKQTLHDFLFYSSSDGIIVADADLVIQMVNPAGVAMLGHTLENLIGKSIRQVFGNNPALMNLFTRTGRAGEQSLDVRLSRRRLAIGVGRTLGEKRVVILQDVTEKRELQNRREALIRSISHDLNNPIAAITGFIDLVQRSGNLEPLQQKFINKASETAGKLLDVLSQLVDLAWIESGMPLDHKSVDLTEIIHRAIGRVKGIAQEQKIVIVTSLQTPMPTVMGDPERLEEIVYQLLHNAVIYSHPEQMIVIHSWSDKGDVYCSVADRGIGITDDELDMIFNRLYRSKSEYVANTTGGGLGLTFAKTVIQRHGGDIWASSNFGQGSTFTFILPIAK
jgi:PAS domain S-box-containing protein